MMKALYFFLFSVVTLSLLISAQATSANSQSGAFQLNSSTQFDGSSGSQHSLGQRKVINKVSGKSNLQPVGSGGDNPTASDGSAYMSGQVNSSKPSSGQSKCSTPVRCQAGWSPIVDSNGCQSACQPQKGGPEPADRVVTAPPRPPKKPAVCPTISMICNDGETPIADINGCVAECSKGVGDRGDLRPPGPVCPMIAPVCSEGTHPVPDAKGCFLSCASTQKAIQICKTQKNICGKQTAIRDPNTNCILSCQNREPATIDGSGSSSGETGSSTPGVR